MGGGRLHFISGRETKSPIELKILLDILPYRFIKPQKTSVNEI